MCFEIAFKKINGVIKMSVYSLDSIEGKIQNNQFWFVGKHNHDFVQMLYKVDILRKLPVGSKENVFRGAINHFNQNNPPIVLEAAMFKSLISAKTYGLLDNSNTLYSYCKPTDVFFEILAITNGDFFQKRHLYQHIIERQIEKIYYFTDIFKDDGNRQSFQLYPLMLLYKILTKLQSIVGSSEITLDEFKVFITTAEKYQDWPIIVQSIIYYRLHEDVNVKKRIKKAASLADGRFNNMVKNLETIVFEKGKMYLKESEIAAIENKVAHFEAFQNRYPKAELEPRRYMKFLQSNDSLF
jgi:hypothetical protein